MAGRNTGLLRHRSVGSPLTRERRAGEVVAGMGEVGAGARDSDSSLGEGEGTVENWLFVSEGAGTGGAGRVGGTVARRGRAKLMLARRSVVVISRGRFTKGDHLLHSTVGYPVGYCWKLLLTGSSAGMAGHGMTMLTAWAVDFVARLCCREFGTRRVRDSKCHLPFYDFVGAWAFSCLQT